MQFLDIQSAITDYKTNSTRADLLRISLEFDWTNEVSNTLLAIDNINVEIIGRAKSTQIDLGGHQFIWFTPSPGAIVTSSVKLSNITFIGGHGDNGSVISVNTKQPSWISVSIEDCAFIKCSANQNGGAISFEEGVGSLSLLSLNITNTYFQRISAGVAPPEGVASYGSVMSLVDVALTMTNVQIGDTSMMSDNGFGVIYAKGGSINMVDCTFTGNSMPATQIHLDTVGTCPNCLSTIKDLTLANSNFTQPDGTMIMMINSNVHMDTTHMRNATNGGGFKIVSYSNLELYNSSISDASYVLLAGQHSTFRLTNSIFSNMLGPLVANGSALGDITGCQFTNTQSSLVLGADIQAINTHLNITDTTFTPSPTASETNSSPIFCNGSSMILNSLTNGYNTSLVLCANFLQDSPACHLTGDDQSGQSCIAPTLPKKPAVAVIVMGVICGFAGRRHYLRKQSFRFIPLINEE
eukprot:gene11427-13319_t